MEENIKEWWDLIAVNKWNKIWKRWDYIEIKHQIKWDLVFVQEVMMLLNQWLNLNGMLIVSR